MTISARIYLLKWSPFIYLIHIHDGRLCFNFDLAQLSVEVLLCIGYYLYGVGLTGDKILLEQHCLLCCAHTQGLHILVIVHPTGDAVPGYA